MLMISVPVLPALLALLACFAFLISFVDKDERGAVTIGLIILACIVYCSIFGACAMTSV